MLGSHTHTHSHSHSHTHARAHTIIHTHSRAHTHRSKDRPVSLDCSHRISSNPLRIQDNQRIKHPDQRHVSISSDRLPATAVCVPDSAKRSSALMALCACSHLSLQPNMSSSTARRLRSSWSGLTHKTRNGVRCSALWIGMQGARVKFIHQTHKNTSCSNIYLFIYAQKKTIPM